MTKGTGLRHLYAKRRQAARVHLACCCVATYYAVGSEGYARRMARLSRVHRMAVDIQTAISAKRAAVKAGVQ